MDEAEPDSGTSSIASAGRTATMKPYVINHDRSADSLIYQL
jgi:hypothetical protein